MKFNPFFMFSREESDTKVANDRLLSYSAGLVGQFMAYESMVSADFTPTMTLLLIALMHFVLPAAISLAVAEGMRKLNLIKHGDLKLDNV